MAGARRRSPERSQLLLRNVHSGDRGRYLLRGYARPRDGALRRDGFGRRADIWCRRWRDPAKRRRRGGCQMLGIVSASVPVHPTYPYPRCALRTPVFAACWLTSENAVNATSGASLTRHNATTSRRRWRQRKRPANRRRPAALAASIAARIQVQLIPSHRRSGCGNA